jgi:hypothetical protein
MKGATVAEPNSAAEGRSATECGSTVKPAATMETATAVKSTATMKSSATMASTTLRESRLWRAEQDKSEDCEKNCGKGFRHFSHSDRAIRDCLRGELGADRFCRQSNNNVILHSGRA